jgi:hypothetical protein
MHSALRENPAFTARDLNESLAAAIMSSCACVHWLSATQAAPEQALICAERAMRDISAAAEKASRLSQIVQIIFSQTPAGSRAIHRDTALA